MIPAVRAANPGVCSESVGVKRGDMGMNPRFMPMNPRCTGQSRGRTTRKPCPTVKCRRGTTDQPRSTPVGAAPIASAGLAQASAASLAMPFSMHAKTRGQSPSFITPSGGNMRMWYGPWPQ